MTPELRSLIHKEYRERRLPFLLATGWILCGTAYAVLYELARNYHAPVATFHGVCNFYGLFVAIFLAARTALGERTQGTLAFSAALPVALRTTAAVRFAGAVATLILPMFLGAVVVSIAVGTGLVEQMPRRPHVNYVRLPDRELLSAGSAIALLWTVTAVAAAQAVTLMCLVATIGARRKSEAIVAFIGAPLAMLWIMGTAIRIGPGGETAGWANWLGSLLPQALVINYGYGDELGSYTDLDVAPRVWGPLAVNFVLLVLMGAWFAHRYGRLAPAAVANNKRRLRLPRLLARVPNPLPGRIASLAWVDFRQALPLAAAGLAIACLMTAAELLIESDYRYRGTFLGSLAGQLPGSTWIIGTLWSAVVAAGVFGPELQPRLEAFWRSRPISPTSWFWTKYLVGLVAVLGFLDGVTIAVSWNSPYGVDPSRMSLAYIVCMPLIHAMMYSVAVLAVVRWRRPAMGAMATILFFFLATMLIGSVPALLPYEPTMVYNHLFQAERAGELNVRDSRYAITYGTIALVAVASAVAAGQILRRPADATARLWSRHSAHPGLGRVSQGG